MTRYFALASLVALTACSGISIPRFGGDPVATPAVAPAPPPAPVFQTAKERLVSAIENNNCVLNKDNVGAILSEATISAEELTTLTPQLADEGRAEVSGSGSIRVLSDQCI